MYGLDPKIDLSFLVGREIIQVCFGAFDFQVHFDEDVSISVYRELRFKTPSGITSWKPEQNQAAGGLLELLRLRVQQVTAKSDGTLQVTFTCGSTLMLFDTDANFESYTVTAPGRTIVV